MTVHGEKTFTILNDGFEGIDEGALQPVERLAEKLDLESKSLEQVGAISADKISVGTGEEGGTADNGPALPNKNVSIDGYLGKPAPPGPSSPADPSGIAPELLKSDKENKAEIAARGLKKQFSEQSGAANSLVGSDPIWFGLPKSITSKFREQPAKSLEHSLQKTAVQVADWTLFSLDQAEITKETFFLPGKEIGEERRIEIESNTNEIEPLSVPSLTVAIK